MIPTRAQWERNRAELLALADRIAPKLSDVRRTAKEIAIHAACGADEALDALEVLILDARARWGRGAPGVVTAAPGTRLRFWSGALPQAWRGTGLPGPLPEALEKALRAAVQAFEAAKAATAPGPIEQAHQAAAQLLGAKAALAAVTATPKPRLRPAVDEASREALSQRGPIESPMARRI